MSDVTGSRNGAGGTTVGGMLLLSFDSVAVGGPAIGNGGFRGDRARGNRIAACLKVGGDNRLPAGASTSDRRLRDTGNS